MYTADALLDMLERSHRSLAQFIAHCGTLEVEELNREIEGFGIPTIRLQLHHAIGGQRYWIGVLEGRIDAEDDDDQYPTIESLEAYRTKMLEMTERYLRGASPEELNTPRVMRTWGDQDVELTPAHVVLRTLTHFFQHHGQVAAMCRTLGKPIPRGLDYPLRDPEPGS